MADGCAIVTLNYVLHVDAERLVPWHEHRLPERAQTLMATIDRFEVGKVATSPELDLRVSKFHDKATPAPRILRTNTPLGPTCIT